MDEYYSDDLVSLAKAARSLPNRPHVSTLWRWYSKGIKGVRLETVLIGGRRFTSARHLANFFAQVTAGPGNIPADSPSRVRQKEAASKRAASLF